jgi:uncharacterized membrane protein
MTMDTLQTLILVLATLTMGLAAGFMYAYAHDIMPGLGRVDDRRFVAGFQAVDKAVVNPWFLLGYLGAPVLTGLAALLHLGADHRSMLVLTLVSFALYVAVLVITARIHLPLNAQIQAAGDPDRLPAPELAAVRERFEARWVRWHMVRTVLNVAAFACLAWALAI